MARAFAISVCLFCCCTWKASAGTLTGSFNSIAAGTDVNLTTAGVLDWVHWGLYTDSSVDRKTSVAPVIGNFIPLGDSNSFLAVYQFADNANGYTWYDGSPDSVVTNTTTGVWAYSTVPLGSGFEVEVPADTTERTLKVYVGAYNAKGKLTASLSDGSAPDFTNGFGANATVDNHGNGPSGVFTLTYSADSPGQTLTINWTVATPYGADANVTLQAAALSAPGADNPPYATITSPAPNSAFAEPADIALHAEAQDFDGSVTNVTFYAGTNELAQVASTPYDFTWSNVPRGHYSITAVATDNQGVSSTSQPVGIFVYGPGGSETGSVSNSPALVDLTSEGSQDWTHWGLTTNTSFDYKSGVSRQISNFTELGTNAIQQYSDNYTAFSWSDGEPTPSVTGTTTGIFVTGVTNGFLLTAPADTTPRQLRLYVGGYGMQAQFQAYLTDLSAAPYTDTSLSNQYGNSYAVYTVNYSAASAGQQLVVSYRSQSLFDLEYGNVTLQSATLQGGSTTVTKLPVQLENPAMNGSSFVFSFLSQSNVGYAVESSSSLPATTWTPLTNVDGTGGMIFVTNHNATDAEQFYRVQTQQ